MKFARGFNCKNPECRKWHEFGAYVAAHWTALLVHTCDGCGWEHEVCSGRVKVGKKVYGAKNKKS